MVNATMENRVIKISSSFDVEEADKFRTEANSVMEDNIYNFILDFSNCNFIDSTGLGVIVSVYKKCIENEGSVRLRRLNLDVLKVFKLTRLDKVFKIEN